MFNTDYHSGIKNNLTLKQIKRLYCLKTFFRESDMVKAKNLYLSKIQLKAELERCLNCPSKPCMSACPVNCSPQEFIAQAKSGYFEQAVETISRNNPMGQNLRINMSG